MARTEAAQQSLSCCDELLSALRGAGNAENVRDAVALPVYLREFVPLQHGGSTRHSVSLDFEPLLHRELGKDDKKIDGNVSEVPNDQTTAKMIVYLPLGSSVYLGGYFSFSLSYTCPLRYESLNCNPFRFPILIRDS